MRRYTLTMLALASLAWPATALAQAIPDMPGMDMPRPSQPTPATPTQAPMPMSAATAMPMTMTGAFGPYATAREASGTAWQPDSTPDGGLHFMLGRWMLMAHGYADAIYDNQGGSRGAVKGFSASMGMLMAQRSLGADGTFGLRAMMSLDRIATERARVYRQQAERRLYS